VKAVVAGSKVKALEAEATMDNANIAKEKAKALVDELKAEKQLMLQKDK